MATLMFAYLKRYPKIVVTGPPRSGTRIASKMIAHDTGHRYIDEAEHDFGDDEARWRMLLQQSNIVVQSPGLIKACVNNPPVGVFLVLMRRNVDDIHASQQRIDRHRYQGLKFKKVSLADDNRVLGAYSYWDDHSKQVPALEVSYESLASHPLWIDAGQRTEFWIDQTAHDDASNRCNPLCESLHVVTRKPEQKDDKGSVQLHYLWRPEHQWHSLISGKASPEPWLSARSGQDLPRRSRFESWCRC